MTKLVQKLVFAIIFNCSLQPLFAYALADIVRLKPITISPLQLNQLKNKNKTKK